MKALKISHEKKGISTAAEWVTSLRAEGSLAVNSVGLNTFLEGLAVTSWPTAGVAAFPPDDATETATCLHFVTARINEVASFIVTFTERNRMPRTMLIIHRRLNALISAVFL